MDYRKFHNDKVNRLKEYDIAMVAYNDILDALDIAIDVDASGIRCVPLWTWERVNWLGADHDDRMWVVDRIATFLDWSELQ